MPNIFDGLKKISDELSSINKEIEDLKIPDGDFFL